jgi:hypothetical protein
MPRKNTISRERALTLVMRDILGTDNDRLFRNLRYELEAELIPTLEKYGYTIVTVDAAFRGDTEWQAVPKPE